MSLKFIQVLTKLLLLVLIITQLPNLRVQSLELNKANSSTFLQDNFGYDMGDWKQNTAIVVTTAVVVAATVFTGGLATTLVGGAIGAGAVATGAGLATAYLVGNVLSYLGGSVMNGKLLDPKEFACGNKEANAVECVSYQGGQLLTGAILTQSLKLATKRLPTTKTTQVTQSLDDLKKVGNYVDDVDNIKIKKVTSTKVNIDGGEYLFDGEFYYKDGKTFLRVLDPDGSLSAAKGKMVEIPKKAKTIDINHINERHSANVEFSDKLIKPNKYLPNANIESLINEGLNSSNKTVTPTTSTIIINGSEVKIPSYQIDVDFGRQIGTNYNKTTAKTNLRIIIDTEGNVISAYPK
jgi:hypothetical protein